MASTTFLQQAYLAYFGRPADVSGMSFYKDKTEAEVVAAFSASPESQAFFGSMELLTKIDTIYQNLFNRAAEPAGLVYWANQVNSGQLSLAQAAMVILNGAQNDDKVAVTSKLAASAAFTAALDSNAEMLGYTGTASIAPARAFLASVSDAATLASAIDATALNASVASVVGAGAVVQFTALTTGADTIPGTPADATITATGATLTVGDSINGGAGNDTLKVVETGAGLAAGVPANVKVTAVENISITSGGAVGRSAVAAVVAAPATKTTQILDFAAGGAITAGTLTASWGGVTNALTSASITTAGGAATFAAAALNALAGSTVATVYDTTKVIVIAPTAGAGGMPAFAVAPSTSGGITFATPGGVLLPVTAGADAVAAKDAVTEVAYDVSGWTDATTAGFTAVGIANVKAAATQTVTVTNTSGISTKVAGGLNPTVTTDAGALSVTGVIGQATVTNNSLADAAATIEGKAAITATIKGITTGAVTVTGTQNAAIPAAPATLTTPATEAVPASANGDINLTTARLKGTITVDGGNNVVINDTTSLIATDLNGGFTKVGSTVAPAPVPMGNVSVFQKLNGAPVASVSTGGVIEVKGGAHLLVDVEAKAGVLGATTTIGNITVTGTATTVDAVITQSAKVAGSALSPSVKGTGAVEAVTFVPVAAAGIVLINGLTFTAGPTGATAAQVAQAFANLTVNKATGGAVAPAVGTFSGEWDGTAWSTGPATGATVNFTKKVTTAAVTAASLTLTGATGVTSSLVTIGAADAAAVTTADLTKAYNVTTGNVLVNDAAYASGAGPVIGTLNNVKASNYGTLAVNSSGLSTLTLSNTGTEVTGTATISSKSAAPAASQVTALTVNTTGKLGAIAIATANNSYKSLTLNAEGATTLTNTALVADGVTKLSVTGAGSLTSTTAGVGVDLVTGFAALTVVDASAATGNVSVKVDPSKASFTGGAGNDTVELSSTSITNPIAAGAGTDTLKLTDANAATISGATTATYLSGFEALSLSGAGTSTVDVSKLGAIDAVTLATTTVTTLTNLVSGGTISLADTQSAGVTLTNAKWAAVTSTADVLNINVALKHASTLHAAGTVTTTGIETINIVSTDNTASDATYVAGVTNKNTLTLVDTGTALTPSATTATTVNVSGTAALDLTYAAAKVVDASAMSGNFTYTTGTTGATVTGGAGSDTLTAATSATGTYTLNGGAGNDTLTANAGTNVLTGGAGNDTFVVAVANTNKVVMSTITDFSAGDTLKLLNKATETFTAAKVTLATGATESLAAYANAAAAGDGNTNGAIKWFQFGGDTYVVEDQSTGATFVDGTDVLVKLTGLIDLSNASFSGADASTTPVPSITLFA